MFQRLLCRQTIGCSGWIGDGQSTSKTLFQQRPFGVDKTRFTAPEDEPPLRIALTCLRHCPALFDQLYAEFPGAYNRNQGSFGLLRAVTGADKLKTKPKTPYGKSSSAYRYPDGFIVPLAFGLRALLIADADGNLSWKTDPAKFITKHLDEIVRKYKVLIQAFGGDAQKIGKNEGSYTLAQDAFETELLKLAQNV